MTDKFLMVHGVLNMKQILTKDMLWICCESFVIDIVNIWENLGQHVICTSRKRYNAKAKPLFHLIILYF